MRQDVNARLSILLLRERFAWMGAHSGYDLLCRALERRADTQTISVFRESKSVGRMLRFVLWRFFRTRSALPLYTAASARAEVKALARTWLHRPSVIHILYGEEQLGAIARWPKPPGTRIVATFHQPVSWLVDKRCNESWLHGVDLVIAMSEAQRSHLAQFTTVPVQTILHGADHAFFRPATRPPPGDRLHLVTVGSWLRDFAMIETVARQLAGQTTPAVDFTLVVPEHGRADPAIARLAALPHVRFLAGLSDTALRDLYQASDALFLPLIDSTANNAMLEAMACGLPVLTTPVGGALDYVHRDAGRFYPSTDPDRLLRDITDWARDKTTLQVMGRKARAHIEATADWQRIAEKTVFAYQSILP